jgi:hypothetical protein
MDPKVMWMVVAVLVVVAVAGWMVWQKRRTEGLKTRFGKEYDRTVQQAGDVRRAEAALEERAKRVERLNIRPLTGDAADRFAATWQRVQAQFVDDPGGAITQADRLVGEVMTARGYPVGDFDRRVEDVSVDHPDVVMNYRAARDIADHHSRGEASTEDLRQAMVHYRSLFRDLLEREPVVEPESTTVSRGRR